MNTKEKLHQLHLNEWAARFSEQKASDLTVRQWCDQNNFSIHTYNHWKHLLKEELASQVLPDIVPLSIPEPVTIPDSAVPFAPAPPKNPSLTNCAIRTMNILVRQSRQSGLSRATIPDERAIRNVMPRKALYMSRHMVSLYA